MIPRHAAKTLLRASADYPVVVVTGPRQSGKTTLCRATLPDAPYASLEDPDVRRFALDDPRGFLAQFPSGAILDEIQRAPDLLSYLQGIVDTASPRPTFILTGSQQLDVLAGVTQTLAGRASLITLLPFSLPELAEAGIAPEELATLLHQGLFPPIHDRKLDPRSWYGNYVQTYIERDVRQLINVRDLTTFRTFVRLCAGRTGQLLNLASLAGDCGINHNTARAWLSALEASFLVTTLRPHFENFGKRLVKTPKLYFLDPGLAAWLLEVSEPAQLQTHPLRGALFETWVISELLKARFNVGLTANLYFWRDHRGEEIDCLIDRGKSLIPVEIKSGRTLATDMLKGVARFIELSKGRADHGWLVYGGDRVEERQNTTTLPWREIQRLARANE